MPISTWDGCTFVIVLLTIVIPTILCGVATKRLYEIKVNSHFETEDCRLKFIPYEKLLLFLAFAIVVCVVGFQMSNSDYSVYESLYQYEYSKSYRLFGVEGLFRAINKFVFDYFHEYQFVPIFVSIITNFFMFHNVIFYSLNSNVRAQYVMFLYLVLYLLLSFGMQRQICAASIVIYSYKYLEKKQFIKYFLLTFLALEFHSTAVISFLLCFYIIVSNKANNMRLLYRTLVVVFFYVAVIFSNQIISLIGSLISRSNFTEYYAPESIGLGNIVIRIPRILFLLYFKKLINSSSKYVRLFADLLWLEVIVCFSYYFVPMLGGRFQCYTLFGNAIVIPCCLKSIGNTQESKIVSRILIYGYGFFYLIYQLLSTSWITEYLMPIRFFHF